MQETVTGVWEMDDKIVIQQYGKSLGSKPLDTRVHVLTIPQKDFPLLAVLVLQKIQDMFGESPPEANQCVLEGCRQKLLKDGRWPHDP